MFIASVYNDWRLGQAKVPFIVRVSVELLNDFSFVLFSNLFMIVELTQFLSGNHLQLGVY